MFRKNKLSLPSNKVSQVVDLLESALMITKSLSEFLREPNLANTTNIVLTSGLALGKIYQKFNPDPLKGWVMLSWCLVKMSYDVVKRDIITKINLPDNKINAYKLFDETVLIGFEGNSLHPMSLYVRESRIEETKKELYYKFWQNIGSSNLVLSIENSRYSGMITFKDDNISIAKRTKKADNIIEYLKKYMQIGINRTILFYGPPGSGKSSMVKYITKELELNSMRIRAEDLCSGDIENSYLFEIVDFIKPDIVIIEDIDKSEMNVGILEMIDMIKQKVKFLFATANKNDDLNSALLRPGRFDELEHVFKIEENIIKELLGNDNLDLLERIRDWPIAYITDLHNRMKVMSKEEAIASIDELEARLRFLSGKQDNKFTSNKDTDNSIKIIPAQICGGQW